MIAALPFPDFDAASSRALLLVGAGPHFETPGHSYANMLQPPTVFFASSQLFALFVGVLVLVLAQGFRVHVGHTVSYPPSFRIDSVCLGAASASMGLNLRNVLPLPMVLHHVADVTP